MDTLQSGQAITSEDTNCHHTNPQATPWQCHPESSRPKVAFPAITSRGGYTGGLHGAKGGGSDAFMLCKPRTHTHTYSMSVQIFTRI